METNLTNTLGILIAFATLMLLYSIVVTSLVQATQAIFRLRGRNLWRSLTVILKEEEVETPSDSAFDVIASSASAIFKVVENPNSLFKNALGPGVTWLDAGQLEAALRKRSVEIPTEKVASIVSKFEQTERASRKRFQFWTRMLSIAWAAFIAVYFQLSTTDILNRLSSSEAERKNLISIAEQIAREEGQTDEIEIEKEKNKAGSMFYLEPGRDRDFLYKKGKDDDAGAIQWNDVAGVIITVLLLAMGAPFWFNTLKYIVNLRDSLAPDDARGKGGSADSEPDVDQQIKDTTERIARADDPLEKAALKSKLSDLRVLKAKMRSV